MSNYAPGLDSQAEAVFNYAKSFWGQNVPASKPRAPAARLAKKSASKLAKKTFKKANKAASPLFVKHEKFFLRLLGAGKNLRQRVDLHAPTDHRGSIPVADVMPSILHGHSFWVERALSHYESFSPESEIDFIYTTLFAQQKKEVTKVIIRDRKTGGKFDRIHGKYGYHQTRADPVGRSFVLDKFINVFSKGGDRKRIREIFYNMLRRLDLCPSVFY